MIECTVIPRRIWLPRTEPLLMYHYQQQGISNPSYSILIEVGLCWDSLCSTYISYLVGWLQTKQLSKKDHVILESKSLITFLLASKIYLMTYTNSDLP